MEKVKLSLKDALQLESELNGLVNQQTGEIIYEGFLKQNLSIIKKYELKETVDFLQNERKKVNELKDELIKKHGEDDGKGGLMVRTFDEVVDDKGLVISRKFNEKYLEFDKEYAELLKKEIEFDFPEVTKEDLIRAGETQDDYIVLFKLVKK
jgi:hypothetical protein